MMLIRVMRVMQVISGHGGGDDGDSNNVHGFMGEPEIRTSLSWKRCQRKVHPESCHMHYINYIVDFQVDEHIFAYMHTWVNHLGLIMHKMVLLICA